MATRDLHCKEMDLNVELAANLNEAQAAKAIKHTTKAIKQAEVHCTTTACAIQQAYRDSMLMLAHQTKVEGEVGLPSLCGGLWGGHTSLLTWELGDTSVPPTAPAWWCATSQPSRDVNYHPAVGCSRQSTGTSIFYPQCVRNVSTTYGCQTLVLFVGPRCACPKAGGRRWTLWLMSTGEAIASCLSTPGKSS